MSKYTFLLPAYKTKFLKQSLSSILNQTFSDLCVIVSDDCSPEDVKGVVDLFNDPRLTYRRNQRNIGAEHLVDHWNLLLELVDSEYVIMASDDDVYSSDFLQEVDEAINKYSYVNEARSRINWIDENGSNITTEHEIGREYLEREEFLTLVSRGKVLSGIPQYVFKSGPLKEGNGFVNFPSAWYSDDATVASLLGNGIVLIDKALVSVRLSNLSISCSPMSLGMIKNKIDAAVLYIQYMETILYDSCRHNDIIESLSFRARQTLIRIFETLEIKDFSFAVKYIFQKKSDLFPPTWAFRRMAAYIYKRFFPIVTRR